MKNEVSHARVFWATVVLAALLLALFHQSIAEWKLLYFPVLLLGVGLFGLKADYLHPVAAFMAPWVMILILVSFELSDIARPIAEETQWTIMVVLCLATLLSCITPRPGTPEYVRPKIVMKLRSVEFVAFFGLLGVIAIGVLQVVYSGYIPLLRGFSRLTGYIDFGIPSINGFYYSMCAVLGVFGFYVWTVRGGVLYLCLPLAMLCIFFLLVTRQQIIVLFIECLIVYSLVRRRIPVWIVAAGFVGLIVALSIFGEFRSGNIKDIAQIKPAFEWVPTPFIWIYAYSYFNVLNIDNLITSLAEPLYNGISVMRILPSILRPDYDHVFLHETIIFNVSSFIYPVYLDGGAPLVLLYAGIILYATIRSYYAARYRADFFSVTRYGVLYFCCLFSFFDNIWTVLPIVFQIVGFYIIYRICFTEVPTEPQHIPSRIPSRTGDPRAPYDVAATALPPAGSEALKTAPLGVPSEAGVSAPKAPTDRGTRPQVDAGAALLAEPVDANGER